MKRLFESEHGVDLLVGACTEATGIKIGKLLNVAVYSYFLPEVETLNVEANYILKNEEMGELNQAMLSQCLSRGVTWLSLYPIKDCSILKSLILHYMDSPFVNGAEDNHNDYVKSLYSSVEDLIRDSNPDYEFRNISYISFSDVIFSYWDQLWKEKVVYEIFAYIIFTAKIRIPLGWYDGIIYLKKIEEAAQKEHGLK